MELNKILSKIKFKNEHAVELVLSKYSCYTSMCMLTLDNVTDNIHTLPIQACRYLGLKPEGSLNIPAGALSAQVTA